MYEIVKDIKPSERRNELYQHLLQPGHESSPSSLKLRKCSTDFVGKFETLLQKHKRLRSRFEQYEAKWLDVSIQLPIPELRKYSL